MTIEGNSQTKAPTIQFIKFVSGEAVIGEIAVANDGWLITRPLQVFIDRSRGSTELVITPWLPISSTNEKSVIIAKEHVLFHVSVIPEMAEYMKRYADQFYTENSITVKDMTSSNRGKEAKSMTKDDLIELLSKVPTGEDKKN